MNKKGFTLVEVLAVIVLLGVLTAISLPTIRDYIDENKRTFNKQLENQLLLAGKEYFSKNKNLLPRIGYLEKYQDGESKNYVLATELLSNNYIKNDFVDADKNNCSDSYVIVAKNANTKDYDWHACLICGEGENKNVLTQNDAYCSLNANWDDKEKPYCEGTINSSLGDNNNKIYNSNNIDLYITPSDNQMDGNNKNYSSIVVHNKTKDIIYIKDVSNLTENEIKDLDISSYLKTDGEYSVSIKDKGHNKSNACISDFIIDNTNPSCDILGNPTEWVQSATLTVSGEDENGLDILPYSWTSNISGFGTMTTKTITSNGTYTAYVKDVAGNVGDCVVDVDKIDISKPTVTIKNDKTSWTKDNVTVNVSASDGTSGSGIDRIEYSTDNKTWTTLASLATASKIYDTTTNITFYARAIDNVGLISDVKSTTVKVDKTPPNAPKVEKISFVNTTKKTHNCTNVGGGQKSVSCTVCMYVGATTWGFDATRESSDVGSGINSSKTQNKWTHNATGTQYSDWTVISSTFGWAIKDTPTYTKVTYAERNVDKVGNVGYSTTIYYKVYRGSAQESSYNTCVNGL